MHWFLLGLAILVAGILLLQWFVKAEPKQILSALKWVLSILAGLFGVFVLLTGRWLLLLFVLSGLLPWLFRLKALRNIYKSAGGPSAGRQSAVETRFVRMHLDHDTGQMDGDIREGRFQNRKLSQLTENEAVMFWQEAAADPQSKQVIEAYLDRKYGPDWQSNSDASANRGGQQPSGGPMTFEEACEILGLGANPSEADIKRSHRELMKKFHPDHGGSDYLATKINQAKDLLLRNI